MIFTWTKPDATNATSESGQWAVGSWQWAEGGEGLESGVEDRDANSKLQTSNAKLRSHEPRITNHDPIPSAFIGVHLWFQRISYLARKNANDRNICIPPMSHVI
jgi:hypothetical protein